MHKQEEWRRNEKERVGISGRQKSSVLGFLLLGYHTRSINNLARKGFISVYSSTTQYMAEGSQARNLRQEPGGRKL